jgi:hypothetical protein
MDKRIIFAVAGSGKTTHIINKLNLEKRFLIVTYANKNMDVLRKRIIEKFTYFPENIKLKSYFNFVYSFCCKPFLADKLKLKGIRWKDPPEKTRCFKRDNMSFYLNSNNRVYHNRIAKLLEIENVLEYINLRIEKYFDCLYIDEIQDFAGHDFNLLDSIVKANCEILFVGDFYQHTFDTSRDGNLKKNLFKDYELYKEKCKNMGLIVDEETLPNSRRCSKTVCEFISENLGIKIGSISDRTSNVIYINNKKDADIIFKDNSIIKLFYQKHYKYECRSMNWGLSKGCEYENVCVVLNEKTKKEYDRNNLKSLLPGTKAKFYVACSRTKNNLFFVPEEYFSKSET